MGDMVITITSTTDRKMANMGPHLQRRVVCTVDRAQSRDKEGGQNPEGTDDIAGYPQFRQSCEYPSPTPKKAMKGAC